MVERLALMGLILGHRTDGITSYYLKGFVDSLSFTDEEAGAWEQPCQEPQCRRRQDLCRHRDAEIRCSIRVREIMADIFTGMSNRKELTAQHVSLIQKFAPKLLPEEEKEEAPPADNHKAELANVAK
jgi:hypothetical protein